MDPKDSRSFKLAIVADYFVNPSRYREHPQNTVVYEVLRDLGYGILKMPETSYHRTRRPNTSHPSWTRQRNTSNADTKLSQ